MKNKYFHFKTSEEKVVNNIIWGKNNTRKITYFSVLLFYVTQKLSILENKSIA